MITKVLQFIIDGQGKYLKVPTGMLTANDKYTTVIQVITPIPTDTSLKVNYTLMDGTNKDIEQYLVPSKDSGEQVVDKTSSLFALVQDWSVFEIEVSEVAISYLSKYRSGQVCVSFSFEELIPDASCVNYLGKFGENKPLPDSPNYGDFCVCDTYNYVLDNKRYNKGSILVYKYGWVDGALGTETNTETFRLSVNPSISIKDPAYDCDAISTYLAQLASQIIEHAKDISHLTQEEKNILNNISKVLLPSPQYFTEEEKLQIRKNIDAGQNSFSGDYWDLLNIPDNATKDYVVELVTRKIAELIDSAPESLDTLKELADAINSNEEMVVLLNKAIWNKVDKIEGKGLSTNDYTTEEKMKLSHITANANANVQSDWDEDDKNSDAYIKNKPTIPKMYSETGENEDGAMSQRALTEELEKKLNYNKEDNSIKISKINLGSVVIIPITTEDGESGIRISIPEVGGNE